MAWRFCGYVWNKGIGQLARSWQHRSFGLQRSRYHPQSEMTQRFSGTEFAVRRLSEKMALSASGSNLFAILGTPVGKDDLQYSPASPCGMEFHYLGTAKLESSF